MCSKIDYSIKICAIYFSEILCGWNGFNLCKLDLSACNKLYAAMTCTSAGGMYWGSQCVGQKYTGPLIRVSRVAGL